MTHSAPRNLKIVPKRNLSKLDISNARLFCERENSSVYPSLANKKSNRKNIVWKPLQSKHSVINDVFLTNLAACVKSNKAFKNKTFNKTKNSLKTNK